MKYYKVIGVAVCILLIISCLLPWTFHADLNENFTGFFSEKNTYGKPGKILTILALASLALILTDRVWAKRTHIFIGALMVAYAIKTYILYTSCYNAYCPDKRYGLWLTMGSVLAIMLVSFFPNMKIGSEEVSYQEDKEQIN